MTMSRRRMMAGTAGLGMALAFRPLASSAAETDGAGFFRASIGGFEVVALTDGSVRRQLDASFVRNAPLEDVEAALAAAGLPTDHVTNSFTPFVLIADDRHILFDAGFADTGPEGTGLLHENMAAAGIDPGQIETVVMSHLHGDHISGLRRSDGTLVYPDAQVWIPQPELDHWMSEERMAAAPEGAQGGFRAVRRVLEEYPADRITAFTPGDPVADLLASEAGFGHSPGHTIFRFGDGAESFTYIGDAAHYPPLFVANPDWSVMFDMDPDAARTVRRSILGRAAAEGGIVGGYHFPFPAMGRIEPAGEGYAFEAAS